MVLEFNPAENFYYILVFANILNLFALRSQSLKLFI